MGAKVLVITSKFILRKELVNAVSALLTEEGYSLQMIEAETINSDTEFTSYPIIVYCLGSYYYEQSLGAFSRYVQMGGKLILLSGNPFSKAYGIKDGQIYFYKECSKGIRAFEFGDTFVEINLPKKPLTLQIFKEEYGVSREQVTGVCSAWSGLYHLSVQDEQGEMQKESELVSIAAFLDEDKHQVASPVVEIRMKEGGILCCFLWENASENILESYLAGQLLLQVCKKGTVRKPHINVEMEYAFYRPEETPILCIEEISNNETADVCYNLTIRKMQGQSVEEVYKKTSFYIKGTSNLSLPVKEEGQYEVILDVYSENIWMDSVRTGFYLLSEKELTKAVKNVLPVRIDPNISTDFCIRGEKPYPIHGTTYFVTDVFQKCFLHFNLACCDQDMKRLKEDGFNTLRSGNWMLNVEFLGEDGTICERARRALYAYFLCACKYDFIVQFTLGCVTLNDWDRSKCAVHNPENMVKVLNLVDSFTKLYRIFPNVVLDVVNEPSYSYGGSWTLGRPSYDPFEKKAWQNWLLQKYQTIENLRQAWGENPVKVSCFESITMPEGKDFAGNFYRTEEERDHAKVADFYHFARESYSAWLKQIRQLVRKNAPNMMVIMGRDESLRVPCEQDEVLQGNLDMVCWHQWNRNSIIYTEYMLNRVKGMITCAQELGIYRVERMRGGKILTDQQIASQLMRKILFGFGNWIQWQSFDNPDKVELSENMLGIYRADGSETAAMQKLRLLMEAENRGMKWCVGRQEEAFPILTVYGTSSHFSTYSGIAQEGLRKHFDILSRKLRNQSDVMLEHLFDRVYKTAIGKPALIILPSVMRLTQHCWEELLAQVEKGVTLLVSGCIEEDEHFCSQARISKLEDKEMVCFPVKDYEFIEIEGERYSLDFRRGCDYAEAPNTLKVAVVADEKMSVKEYVYGDGTIIYCPLPLELAADDKAACALYRYAVERAQAQNRIYNVLNSEGKENFEIYAIVYPECTVYTIINDGPAAELELLDIRSGKVLQFNFADLGMAKIWVGTDGNILNEYISEWSVRL